MLHLTGSQSNQFRPVILKEIRINNPYPGVNSVDVGLGHTNPAELALDEAAKIWPTEHFCLISIGTGRRRAVQVIDGSRANNDDDNINSKQSLFEQIRSFIPSVVEFMPARLSIVQIVKLIVRLGFRFSSIDLPFPIEQ